MAEALEDTGLDIKHMEVAALVIMLELMMKRNAEPIVDNPLKDGEQISPLSCYGLFF